jgi:hypothetical protein
MDYKNVLKTIDEIGGSISDMIKDNKELKEGNKNDG